MLHTLTFRIEAPSPQKATALRTAAHELLDADPDCQVIAANSAKDTTTYTVVGVQDGERVELQVEATTEMEAEAQAPDAMVITDVRTAT